MLAVDFLQEGATPTASGSRAKTIGELAWPFGFFDSYEVGQLSQRNMKTKANVVVGLHFQPIMNEQLSRGRNSTTTFRKSHFSKFES